MQSRETFPAISYLASGSDGGWRPRDGLPGSVVRLPPTDNWQCLGRLSVLTPGEGAAPGFEWGEARGASLHLSEHRREIPGPTCQC